MLIEGLVADVPNSGLSDTNSYKALMGKSAEQIITDLHGRYYTLNYRGRVFMGTTASAGVVLPTTVTTAPVFGVWNPQGSGVNVVPLKLYLGYVTGTGALTTLALGYLSNAGANLGGRITAFAATTPVNCNLGGVAAKQSQVQLTVSAATVTAPVLLRYLGISSSVITTGNANIWGPGMVEEFDGNLIIPPNNFVHVCSAIASGATYAVSLVWAEVPV